MIGNAGNTLGSFVDLDATTELEVVTVPSPPTARPLGRFWGPQAMALASPGRDVIHGLGGRGLMDGRVTTMSSAAARITPQHRSETILRRPFTSTSPRC